MFKVSCFIRKNTKELKDFLIRIGYEYRGKDNNYSPGQNAIYCSFIGYFFIVHEDKPAPVIDCGTNEELFKALAALNSCTDLYQWFVGGNDEWVLNDLECTETLDDFIEEGNMIYYYWHKATLGELIEHFKK